MSFSSDLTTKPQLEIPVAVSPARLNWTGNRGITKDVFELKNAAFPWATDSYLKGLDHLWDPSAVLLPQIELTSSFDPSEKQFFNYLLRQLVRKFHLENVCPVDRFSRFLPNFQLRKCFAQHLFEDSQCYHASHVLAEALNHNHPDIFAAFELESKGQNFTSVPETAAKGPEVMFENKFNSNIPEDSTTQILAELMHHYLVVKGVNVSWGWLVTGCPNFQNERPQISSIFKRLYQIHENQIEFACQLIAYLTVAQPESHSERFFAGFIEHLYHWVNHENQQLKNQVSSSVWGISPDLMEKFGQYQANQILSKLGLPQIFDQEAPISWELYLN